MLATCNPNGGSRVRRLFCRSARFLRPNPSNALHRVLQVGWRRRFETKSNWPVQMTSLGQLFLLQQSVRPTPQQEQGSKRLPFKLEDRIRIAGLVRRADRTGSEKTGRCAFAPRDSWTPSMHFHVLYSSLCTAHSRVPKLQTDNRITLIQKYRSC